MDDRNEFEKVVDKAQYEFEDMLNRVWQAAEEMNRPPIESDVLKQLAIDVHDGKVFTSLHCESSMVRSVFMPILFISPEVHDVFRARRLCMFYEYFSEAGPRSINGYPIFMSVRYLYREDFLVFQEHLKAYMAMKEEFAKR